VSASGPPAAPAGVRLRFGPRWGAVALDSKRPQNRSRGPARRAVTLKVASPALEGRANAMILEFVAQKAGSPGRAAVLVAGAKSRNKVVRVEGISALELRSKLLEHKE